MEWEPLGKNEDGLTTERAPVDGGYLYRCWTKYGFGARPSIAMVFVPYQRRHVGGPL